MLPYTAEVLNALLADYHAAIAPARLLGWLAGAALTVVAMHGGRRAWRAIAALLAAGWLWVGLVFHYGYFSLLNFAAPAYAVLFCLQALLLLVAGSAAGRLRGPPPHIPGWAGLLVAGLALGGQPLLALALGTPWHALPLPGTAPTPTALLTVGVLLLAAQPPWYLFLLPGLWAVIAGASGWILGTPRELILPLAVAWLPLLLWLGRRRRPGAAS